MRPFPWRVVAMLALLCGSCGRGPAPLPPPPPAPPPPVAQTPIAAKGPDSAEARVLAALPAAPNLRVLVLEPSSAGAPPTRDCRIVACLERNPIVGAVAVVGDDQREQVATLLDHWFAKSLQARSDCVPRYRHAIVFAVERGETAVLLDFDCGKYEVMADGTATVGVVANPGGRDEMNALMLQVGGTGNEPPP